MAELFDKDRTVIGRHIRNIYKEEELEQDITCAKFAQVQIEGELKKEGTVKEYLTVQQEGKRKVSRIVKYYDLDEKGS